ncbi:MAG: sigma-70 family RNA polymerase sigma factor [Bacteroidaceae bacterium]|nr:sigma-70 family RNA polymerase sigma factor [Bacteroidaceae bacterium]
MATDEQQLIQDILGGRTEAFGTLVRRYGAPLTSFVACFVAQHDDVDEVVQQSFVAAFEHLSQYDARRASFSTWLWRIARHTAFKHLTRRRPLFIEEQQGAVQSLTDSEADDLLREATDARIAILQRATDLLPSDDQLLLHLYYAEQHQLTDIAYILDTNANALSSRLYRIRQHLAQLIKRFEHEAE